MLEQTIWKQHYLLINLCLKINATGNPGCTLFNSECTISAGNTLRIGPDANLQSLRFTKIAPWFFGVVTGGQSSIGSSYFLIIGADFHRAVVATAPGEKKLLIGCRPVKNWTRHTIQSLFFVQKITFVFRKINKNCCHQSCTFWFQYAPNHLSAVASPRPHCSPALPQTP